MTAEAGKPLTLQALRGAMEGIVPAVMATASADGVPNVAYLSQVEYVDDRHVALSHQFFNTTRRNVLATRRATLLMVDPATAMMVRLSVRYLRTEENGALFERMKARLAGIASYSGMDGVFRLLGSDIYEVEAIETVDGRQLPATLPQGRSVSAVRELSQRLSGCTDLAQLLDEALAGIGSTLGLSPAMLLLMDETGRRLYTVASHGYAASGIGSEIELGQGVIGVAAREGTPIRLGHFASAYAYARALRDTAADQGLPAATEIPFPGLEQPRSQLAVPLRVAGRTLGVLFAESARDHHFSHHDEDALAVVAAQLAGCIAALHEGGFEAGEAAAVRNRTPQPAEPAAQADTAPLLVRRFPANDSVFLGEDYLIKGVAGAIFWKLLRDHQQGRTQFSNRELRLDPTLRLPEVSDNLEARLILLQRRLEERQAPVRIVKTGRGRFALEVRRALELAEMPG
ncbi:MAG: GAF domain-containing protein [Aquabacterium sp.]|nr:MAG: GAF domain-containing protein [Aquabacterium sp.]